MTMASNVGWALAQIAGVEHCVAMHMQHPIPELGFRLLLPSWGVASEPPITVDANVLFECGLGMVWLIL